MWSSAIRKNPSLHGTFIVVGGQEVLSVTEKRKIGKGGGEQGSGVAFFKRIIREGLSEKVIFEYKSEKN